MHVEIIKKGGFQLLFEKMHKHFLLLVVISFFSIRGFAQPANDDPCNAIPLTPDLVCNSQVFTNLNATPATGGALPGIPAPGCANYQGGDVWFQAVVPAGGSLIFETQAGTVTDCGMAVYRGTCSNLQLIACDDDSGPGFLSLLNLTSLTPGSTVFIRVWEYGGNGNGTFGICVRIPPPPPINDDPCNAIALPTPTTTCNYATYTNESATATLPAPPAPGCAGYAGGDVWFTVVVPAGGILSFDTQVGAMDDGGMAIYRGACDNLQLLACDDNSSVNGLMPQIVQNSLTPGSTIYIRVWENGNNNNGTFGICVSIPPPPPANDEPCGAIPLTVGGVCNYATFTTESATNTSGPPAPGCANYAGGDVWFKIVVPCEGSLQIDTKDMVITDGGMALYRGDCATGLQLITCNDDGSANGLMPLITANSLTPGSTVWVRFWEFGNDVHGTFGICVTVPPPPGPAGSCSTAQPFCSSNTYTFPNSTNVPSLGGGGIYGCLGSTPNPVWYYLQIQNTGPLVITITQTSTAGNIIDVDYAVWGPFPSLAASCGNLTAGNIVSCSYSTAGIETATIPNAQAGEFYVMIITNFNNQPGSISFLQTNSNQPGAGSSNCAIICTLTAANTGPVCGGGLFNLTASNVANASYVWTGPNCFTSTDQNPTGVTAPTSPGTYTYTVTATTPSGTTCSAQTIVTVLPKPNIGIDTSVYVCKGSTRDLTNIYNMTGLVNPSWSIYPGGAPVPDSTAVGIAGTYQLIAANAGSCVDTALVTLIVDTVRATVTSSMNATCFGPGSIEVNNPTGVGSVFDYSIETSPAVFQASNIFSASDGLHTIITRDSLNCLSDPIPVTVGLTNDLSTSVTTDPLSICLGKSVTLTATGGATSYNWFPATDLSAGTGTSVTATPASVGDIVYNVEGTLGACKDTAMVTVNVFQSVTVEAGGPITIDAGGSAQILATTTGTPASITWTPPTGLSASNILNPVLTPVVNTGTLTYEIKVTSTDGCFAEDELIVNILPNCRNVRNAFTPNGDGMNDLWLVYDDFSCLQNVTVNVFNRYGSSVYESKNYRNTWDGRYKGKSLPDGTYYAVVEFRLITGRSVTVRSDVTILR